MIISRLHDTVQSTYTLKIWYILTAIVCITLISSSGEPERPNILLILADDVGR